MRVKPILYLGWGREKGYRYQGKEEKMPRPETFADGGRATPKHLSQEGRRGKSWRGCPTIERVSGCRLKSKGRKESSPLALHRSPCRHRRRCRCRCAGWARSLPGGSCGTGRTPAPRRRSCCAASRSTQLPPQLAPPQPRDGEVGEGKEGKRVSRWVRGKGGRRWREKTTRSDHHRRHLPPFCSSNMAPAVTVCACAQDLQLPGGCLARLRTQRAGGRGGVRERWGW